MVPQNPPKGIKAAEFRGAYWELIAPIWRRAGMVMKSKTRLDGVTPRAAGDYVLHEVTPDPRAILELGSSFRIGLVVTPIPRNLQNWGRSWDVIALCSEFTQHCIAELNERIRSRVWEGLRHDPGATRFESSLIPQGGPTRRRRELLREFHYFDRADIAAWAALFETIASEALTVVHDEQRFPRDLQAAADLERKLAGESLEDVLKKLKR